MDKADIDSLVRWYCDKNNLGAITDIELREMFVSGKIISPVQTLKERVKQLRMQMMVHSCIYYRLSDNIISDHVWQDRANELALIQELCDMKTIGFYDDYFLNWDGSTGFHLPVADPFIVSKAIYLLEINGKFNHDEHMDNAAQ